MRYYAIDITNPKTGAQVLPASLGGNRITSLLPNGNTNPAALNIELDIPFAPFATPTSAAWVRIWGLGIQAMTHAFDVNGMNIAISVGMAKGLPLANPAQQGVVLKGQVFQAYGNWVGTDQTFDMNFAPSAGTPEKPANFSFNWRAGTPLSSAISQTLTTAFPGLKQSIQISNNLVLSHDEPGIYRTAKEFADYINEVTQPILGGSYGGVHIASDGQTVTVWDGTVQPAANQVKQIAPQDMVGQPTWLGINQISLKLVMRGDLDLFDTIQIPPTVVSTAQQSYSQFRNNTTLPGRFKIIDIHHYGNYRQPDAASWNTTIQAITDTGT